MGQGVRSQEIVIIVFLFSPGFWILTTGYLSFPLCALRFAPCELTYDNRLPPSKFHALARIIFQRYASGTVGAAR